MTTDTIALRLRDLIAEAEDAGLPPDEIAAQLEAAAEAIRIAQAE